MAFIQILVHQPQIHLHNPAKPYPLVTSITNNIAITTNNIQHRDQWMPQAIKPNQSFINNPPSHPVIFSLGKREWIWFLIPNYAY